MTKNYISLCMLYINKSRFRTHLLKLIVAQMIISDMVARIKHTGNSGIKFSHIYVKYRFMQGAFW